MEPTETTRFKKVSLSKINEGFSTTASYFHSNLNKVRVREIQAALERVDQRMNEEGCDKAELRQMDEGCSKIYKWFRWI